MFARPRPKKNALVPPPKRRKVTHAVEEIKFDAEARDEYLTGFHKRKVQRTKRAQEEAAKRARQEKIDIRKQVRPPTIKFLSSSFLFFSPSCILPISFFRSSMLM